MKEGLRSRDISSQLEPDDAPLSSLLPKKKKKGRKSSGKKDLKFDKRKKPGDVDSGRKLGRRGRKKKEDVSDVNDSVVVKRINVGRGRPKRKRETKLEKKSSKSEAEISGDDENEVKRSRLDVFEYNEDDLIQHKTTKGESGSEYSRGRVESDKRKRSKTDKETSLARERNGVINVPCSEMDEGKTNGKKRTAKEKSNVSRTNRVDTVVLVNKSKKGRSEGIFDSSETQKSRTSRSVEDSIGRRTRSAVNIQKSVNKTGLEKDSTPKGLSAKKNKQQLAEVDKVTSLKHELGTVGTFKKRKKKEGREVDKDKSSQHERGTVGSSKKRKKQEGKVTLTTETKLPKERKRCEVKELIRNQIKQMVESAGWKIDFRPRNNKDYLDVVYIDHKGCTYWSVLKAYYALQKQFQNKESDPEHSGSGFTFKPIPQETLDILTRRTKQRIAREMGMTYKADKRGKKAKGTTGKDSAEKKRGKKSKDSSMNRETVTTQTKRDGRGRPKKNAFTLDRKKGIKRSYIRKSDKGGSAMQNGMPKPPDARKNKTKRGYRLLVRKSDKEVDANGGIAYTGKRTVFSWLVDSEIVSLGSKVKYMNKKGKRALLEGWITKDGIKCGCCSETVTISEFEIHAGSKLRQACQNIFVETGVPLFQCQIDAWKKQEESERNGYHCIEVSSDDPNDDTCGICGDGGDLICCDGCPSTFHQSCLGIQALPNGDWHCFNCCCKFCGLTGCRSSEGDDAAIQKLLTCSLCEEKYHGSCTLQRTAVSDGLDSFYTSFCGRNCEELFEKLQKLLGVKHELEEGFSWTLIQRTDLGSDTSLCGLTQKVECNSKLALALSVMDECFLPTVDERSGINLLHNVVYNCGSNFNRLNYSGFYTFLLERGDELISAASIRVHGIKFAEMPFIGTRHIYRRQGMCRRLLNAIESSLGSLGVEKLIIPAISELMNTWTVVFGFSPLEESHRLEMRSVNVIVFPGVQLLQKLLPKHSSAEVTVMDGSGTKAIEFEGDNHATAEVAENFDNIAVKHGSCVSDATADQDKNGDADVLNPKTGLQAPGGLVQDTSGTSIPSEVPAEMENVCYNSQSHQKSIFETKSLLPGVEANRTTNYYVRSNCRASEGDLDNAEKIHVNMDGVGSDIGPIAEDSSLQSKDVSIESLDLHATEGRARRYNSQSQCESSRVEIEAPTSEGENDPSNISYVESKGYESVGSAVNDVQEINTMIGAAKSDIHSLSSSLSQHATGMLNKSLDMHHPKDKNGSYYKSQDDSSTLANGTKPLRSPVKNIPVVKANLKGCIEVAVDDSQVVNVKFDSVERDVRSFAEPCSLDSNQPQKLVSECRPDKFLSEKTESESNICKAEREVAVSETHPKSMGNGSLGCTSKVKRNGVAPVACKGYDFRPISCSSSAMVGPAQANTRHRADEIVIPLPGSCDLKDSAGGNVNAPFIREEIPQRDPPDAPTESIFQKSSDSSCSFELQHMVPCSMHDAAVNGTGSKCLMTDFVDQNSRESGEGDGCDMRNFKTEVDLEKAKVNTFEEDSVYETSEVINGN